MRSERGQRRILHADMDAFYASVEQRDRPELRGRPVIVGGTGRRGVVSSASYEARRFGVRSAMPTGQARGLCPEGVFLPGDMPRYVRESKRIFEIFHSFTPLVEGLSLDEAFLDVTGSERLQGPARSVAERLRSLVRERTGLAVSVGIAPVKLVAKIASDLAKPDGWLEVEAHDIEAFLAPLPVGRLWGVGPVAEARLRAAGLRTIGELAGCDASRVESVLGPHGRDLQRLARGDDSRTVDPERAPVSISEESTFGEDVMDPAKLEATALTHAEAVARRLRHAGLRARTVVLKLKLAQRRRPGPRGFDQITRRCSLGTPTDDGDALYAAARALLARAALAEPVRLLGVGVTGLESGEGSQLDLFAPGPGEGRRARINRAIDAVAERFGQDSVLRAGAAATQRAGLTQQAKRGE
jgi:DNA polymerase-4